MSGRVETAESRAVRDKLVPPATILLDRERRLRCDFNALALIEEHFGIDALDNLQGVYDLIQSKSARTRRRIFWIFCLDDDPTLTEEEAGALLRLGRIADIWNAMMDAFNNSLTREQDMEGVADASGEKEGAPESALDGLTSGLLPARISSSDPESSAVAPPESSSPAGDDGRSPSSEPISDPE